MPATSEKQKRFMDAAAHNPKFAKAAGIPTSVAKDFSEASKGMKFGSGGPKTRADAQSINKPKTNHGESGFFSKGGQMATKMKMFEKSSKDVEPKGMREGSKKEEAYDRMQMKKMAEGGKTDMAQDKAMIKKAFKQHDMQEHKGGKGTTLKLAKGGSFRASANGVATKGKTKGTMIAMCGGGMYKGKK
jgi:hypothetical protein